MCSVLYAKYFILIPHLILMRTSEKRTFQVRKLRLREFKELPEVFDKCLLD